MVEGGGGGGEGRVVVAVVTRGSGREKGERLVTNFNKFPE